jgi:hypothetical protein
MGMSRKSTLAFSASSSSPPTVSSSGAPLSHTLCGELDRLLFHAPARSSRSLTLHADPSASHDAASADAIKIAPTAQIATTAQIIDFIYFKVEGFCQK